MAKKAEKKNGKIPLPIRIIIYGALLFATYQCVSTIVLSLFGETVVGTVDVYGSRIDSRGGDVGRSRTITKGYYFTVNGKTYRGRATYHSDEAWPSLKKGETRRERIRYLPFFPYVNNPSSLGDFSVMTWGQIFYYLFVPFGCLGLYLMLTRWEKPTAKQERGRVDGRRVHRQKVQRRRYGGHGGDRRQRRSSG